MSDSLSKASEADIEKIKPLLQDRNDALDLFLVAEDVLKEYNDDRLWERFSEADFQKLKTATDTLRNAVLGEYDRFNVKVKSPVSLEKMKETKDNFEAALSSLSYNARDYFRMKLFRRQDDREERLEKSLEAYLGRSQQAPAEKKLRPVIQQEVPSEKKEVAPEPAKTPSKPANWPKFQTPEAVPGIKRVAPKTDNWFRLTPAISEMVKMPATVEGREIGAETVDDVLWLLDKELSLDTFLNEAYQILPPYYTNLSKEELEEKLKIVKDKLQNADQPLRIKRLEKALTIYQQKLNNLRKMDSNLRFLHKNWIPMDTKSNLTKEVGSYKISLGEKDVTLKTTDFEAVLKFSSSEAACAKFLELNTSQEIETAFEVSALAAMEKLQKGVWWCVTEGKEVPPDHLNLGHRMEWLQDPAPRQKKAAADISSIVKPNTKGPSAEEEKMIVDSLVDWLNSTNAQGSEEDITTLVIDYIDTKAPDYHDENVERVARKAYAEWKASQPIPSEVGREGTPNVGVANMDGTGVYVEPSRGNSNVQNEAPMGVRKEAQDADASTCNQCDMGAHERCRRGDCACGCRQEKADKQAGQEESQMTFSVGEFALLNKKVGALEEGTEIKITACSEDEVAFAAGDVLGITKVANLDKIGILKEAAPSKEKYQWDNDGLDYKLELSDRVRVGSIESDGLDLKGKEGTIRDKVIVAANGDAEKYYLVELDGCGTATLPEEALTKIKAKLSSRREAALNHDELTTESVLKPNFDVVEEFLQSYDHPPTVVSITDIEAWLSDPKRNYQYSKKDLKEIVKYLQSAKVEVRAPVKKEPPETLAEAPAEEAALAKEAKKYKAEQTKPDGSKVTVERELQEDMGAGFETDDPTTPGQKMKWVAASSPAAAVCSKCNGIKSIPCDCMDDSLWLSQSCSKCKDEGVLPCPECSK